MATVAQALRFDGELASQLIARAPRWVMGLLVVLIGVRLALLVAQFAGGPAAPAPPATLPPQVTRNVVDIPSILRANLFGQSQAPANAGNAPVTALSLLLAGVFADADDQRGYAMLGSSAADVRLYKVGDVLPGGVRLHAVHVDRVLLDRSGSIETLPMPPRTSASLTPPPPLPAPSPMASVSRVQQLMRENPAVLGLVIQRQAVFADGRLQGMRVTPGANGQAFNRLGLRAGDLVTAINGTPLNDQRNMNEVFSTLSTAAEARVTVMRNGVQQDLVLNLAEVAQEAERITQAPPPDAPPGPDSAR